MLTIQKIIFTLTSLLYLVALVTVIATANLLEYTNFLETMTQENGFFETISVLLLLTISTYGVVSVVKYKAKFNRFFLFTIVAFSLLTFLAGMEEMSWGQHLFHFESSEYFLEHNLQNETNLHNLIPANLFSSIIYSTVYTILVFIPLLYKIFYKQLQKFKLLHYFDINPHTILVVLFASVFQIYFYDDVGVIIDMASHLTALLLFAYFLLTHPHTKSLRWHFIVVVLATIVSMYSQEIYSFFNMQYEIREMFVVLATLLVFIELVEKKKKY